MHFVNVTTEGPPITKIYSILEITLISIAKQKKPQVSNPDGVTRHFLHSPHVSKLGKQDKTLLKDILESLDSRIKYGGPATWN